MINPDGYAVKTRDGDILIRTASDRPAAAKINGLVLLCGLDAHQTYNLTDRDIDSLWETTKGERTIVPVRLVES